MFASSENMIHHSGKGLCTEVMPWHICTFLSCTPSCTHTSEVHDMPESLMVQLISHPFRSFRFSPQSLGDGSSGAASIICPYP